MYKKLRNNFLVIAMFSVTIVLTIIIGIINIVYYLELNSNANRVLDYLALNGGSFPESSTIYGNPNLPFSAETPYRTRYFTVTVNDTNGTISIDTGHIASVLPSQAYVYAQEVTERGKQLGFYKGFKYIVANRINGYQIIFLDFTSELDSLRLVIFISLLLFLVTVAIISVLIFYLSKPIITPIVDNIEKQRQFIADASHEIKTPLAIISADTDVIELERGKDEWTVSIKEQVKRLNELIKNMLTLSKMEGDLPKETISEFDIGAHVKNVAEKFNPIAINDKKEFRVESESGINFRGNMEGVEQLTSVLLNNAFKYTNEEGKIFLKLAKKGRGVLLEVYNTTEKVPDGNLNRLFDRFYRADKSRARKTGSYGIGLSIAKAIVKQHKGHIEAKKVSEHAITFRAVLNSI